MVNRRIHHTDCCWFESGLLLIYIFFAYGSMKGENMEFVLVKHKIDRDRYEAMSDDDISKLVRAYSGRLIKIEQREDSMVLHISAPSTWQTILLNSVLSPYRYI